MFASNDAARGEEGVEALSARLAAFGWTTEASVTPTYFLVAAGTRAGRGCHEHGE